MRAAMAIASISLLASCARRAETQGPVFERTSQSSVMVGKGSGKPLFADLNRDGHLDLVTQHLLDSLVNVMLGDGKGRFTAAPGSPMKLHYQQGTVALADVNNDGIPDLGVASKNEQGEYVETLLGDGRGGFKRSLGGRLRASAAMQFYKPMLRFADINTDGNMDIVMANGRRPTIEVLLGNGAGSFAAQPVVSLGNWTAAGIGSFVIGDVDGDGHADLVASNTGGSELDSPGSIVIKRGDGTGNFSVASPAPLSPPPGTVLVALADMNGDSRLDAVISHGDRNVISVLTNEGGAFSRTPVASTRVEKGWHVFDVLVTDVNRDKRPDLIAATVQSAAPYNSNVAVYLSVGGSFVAAPGSPFAAEPGAYGLGMDDVNEDGVPDVASSSFEGNAVTILFGRATPTSR
jgi:FG-GAP-like repeat